MGASRTVGAALLGVARNYGQVGPSETLRQLNISGLAGRPASDVFLEMVDAICPPGGAVDTANARQAMLETISDMADAGFGNFDTLTPDQLNEVFLNFVARSIEGRVMADIGNHSITLPSSVAAVEVMQEQLHDFVTGCTRNALMPLLADVGGLSDRQLALLTDRIYEAAFGVIAATGEALDV